MGRRVGNTPGVAYRRFRREKPGELQPAVAVKNAAEHLNVDALLWQMRAYRLPLPDAEFRFDPSRKWRFDLAYPERMLAIEVDGGVWVQGRHVTGSGFDEDCRKMSAAAAQGWRVLRFTPAMIDEGLAVRLVEQALGYQEGVQTA